MYKDYQEYHVEDFVWDDDFRQWILFPTAESNAYWNHWLRHNPSRKYEIEEAALLVKGIKVEEPSLHTKEKEEFITKLFNTSIIDTIPHSSPKQKKLWVFAAASVLICLFVTYLIIREDRKTEKTDSNTFIVSTLANAIKTVELPDQSVVTLDKNSELIIPSNFQNQKHRIVHLKGNAFFEVTPDKSKPFYVYIGNIKVEVIGTSFTIKSNSEGNVSVAVKTGKVKVSGSDKIIDKQSGEVILTRNQSVQYNEETKKLVVGIVDEPEISEKEFLSFNYYAVSVDSILSDIEKGYSIKVHCTSPEIGNKTFSGNLEGKGLMEKISIICKALNCSFYQTEGTITIKPNSVSN